MSRLKPVTFYHCGVTFENHTDYVEANIVFEALTAIDMYMKNVFPNLKWAITELTANVINNCDPRNQVQILIHTNSIHKIYEELCFYYIIESKELKSHVELYLISNLLKDISITHEGKATYEAYFAIYNEADRKDGNPLIQMISSNELHEPNSVTLCKNVSRLLASAGEYAGNGCIEVRIKDLKTGEEETLVYADNNGYRILTDPEIKE